MILTSDSATYSTFLPSLDGTITISLLYTAVSSYDHVVQERTSYYIYTSCSTMSFLSTMYSISLLIATRRLPKVDKNEHLSFDSCEPTIVIKRFGVVSYVMPL